MPSVTACESWPSSSAFDACSTCERLSSIFSASVLRLLLIVRLIVLGDHLVGVAENFLLLVAESLQLTLQLFAFRWRLRFFERRLQLAQAVVEIFLPTGKIAELVESFARLLLSLVLLRSASAALSFVAVFVGRSSNWLS